MRLVTLKFLVVTVIAWAVMLAGTGVASATTETSVAGGIQITASLEPDTVLVGQQLNAYYSIANVGGERQKLDACVSLSKDGVGLGIQCRNLVLQPGRSLEQSYSLIVPALEPGIYTLTISAGEASASASVTVSG